MSMALIGVVLLLIFMFTGVPILVAFLLTMMYFIWAGGYDPSFLMPYGFSKVDTIVFLALPMFIIAGALMENAGIAGRLVNAGNKLLGKVHGGLCILAVLASAVFAAISGSAMATVSCIGSILGPRMIKAGYPRGMTAALLAASGVLGLLIPPSVLMIIYSWLSHASVLRCFLSSVIPGFMVMFGLIVTSLIMLRHCDTIQKYIPEKTGKEEEKKQRDGGIIPALIMPIIILGGIYSGLFTATEAATVSCIYAIFVGFFVYKELTVKKMTKTLYDAGVTTGVVMACGLGTCSLGRAFVNENLHLQVLDMLRSLSDNPTVKLLMMNLIVIILGMLMDDDAVVLLTIPILAPMASAIGVDLTHFAAIIGVNIAMANISPPAAPVLYLSGRIMNVPANEMFVPVTIYLVVVFAPILLLTVFFPQLALWLPNLVLGA